MSLSRRHHSESGTCYLRAAANGGGVNSLISNQLSLELRLQDNCRELLNSYKESQDWSAVGQLAQTLVTNSSRISDLKRRLQNQEHLPYLEKIPESEKSQLKKEEGVLGSAEDSEVNPEKPQESLYKAANDSQSCVNKQDSRDLLSESFPGDASVSTEHPVQTGESSPSVSQECASSQISEEVVECAISTSHLPCTNTSDHTSSLKPATEDTQLGGEKNSESVGIVLSVEELNDQMEKLFADLNEQFQDDYEGGEAVNQSEVPLTIAESNAGIGTELEVPEDPKAMYASSESSDQFYSPRDSLYNEGETSDGEANNKEDDLYEDALSRSDSLQVEDGEIPLTFSIERVLVENDDLAQCNHIYSVKTRKASPGFPSSPVLHSYTEFIQLGEGLASSAGRGSIVVTGGSDASADFEAFLNQAASDPSQKGMDCFVDFFRVGDVSKKLSQDCGMLNYSTDLSGQPL